MKMKFYITIIAIAVFFSVNLSLVSAEVPPLAINVNPDQIEIKAAYNGEDLFVTGAIPPDDEVLIRVMGITKDEQFKKKGKALGVLWMNMDTVKIENVPAMLLLALPYDLGELMTQQPAAWRRLGLGFDAVKADMKISPDNDDREMVLDELIKLKQREGLFGVQKDAIRYTTQHNEKTFTASIHVPSSLTPGTYDIQTFVLKDKKIIEETHNPIEAKQVGMPAFLSVLAYQHSLLYGILSVIIAILAGLLTGYLFRGGQGGH